MENVQHDEAQKAVLENYRKVLGLLDLGNPDDQNHPDAVIGRFNAEKLAEIQGLLKNGAIQTENKPREQIVKELIELQRERLEDLKSEGKDGDPYHHDQLTRLEAGDALSILNVQQSLIQRQLNEIYELSDSISKFPFSKDDEARRESIERIEVLTREIAQNLSELEKLQQN